MIEKSLCGLPFLCFCDAISIYAEVGLSVTRNLFICYYTFTHVRHKWLVQNHSQNQTRMFTLTDNFQHLSGENWIVTDALKDHQGTVSIGGRTIANLPLILLMTLMVWQGKRRNYPPWWIAWIRPLQPLAWKLCREDQPDDQQPKWQQHWHQDQR